MAGRDRGPHTIPKTTRRDYLNAVMHLIEWTYWCAVVAILFYTGVDLWVWGASAIIVLPIYIFGLGYLRARLGVLRSS
ncbi:hypothetical protein [Sphingomonas sp. BK069]|uniref:hypothetical protein n=1 Tax=Sphingomonas sp. BK069 TaxID=2586979 RepID=UPI0016160D40|nr:hypothetical protein [Sphingomonas sp. BK069]MBB3349430.1 hypothetical protein [Sphingomonas sp. BK069]